MTTAVATTNGRDHGSVAMEAVLMKGDLKDLGPAQRLEYYTSVCESMGLNPLTRPFDYITLNGKLTLYAKRDAADQLRKLHGVSITITDRAHVGTVYVVTARAQMPDGRCDEATGAVEIGSLKGEALANALMKAETKAKRRVTLSIVGLGWLDESETDSIRGAERVRVDMETGEIHEPVRTPALPAAPADPRPAHQRFDTPYEETAEATVEAIEEGDWFDIPFTFGKKHSGKRMGDVPDSYLDWLEEEWEEKPPVNSRGEIWPDKVAIYNGLKARRAGIERAHAENDPGANAGGAYAADDMPF